jgi:hypothetical protein
MLYNKNQAQNYFVSFWTSLQNYKSPIPSPVSNKIATFDDTRLVTETFLPKM